MGEWGAAEWAELERGQLPSPSQFKRGRRRRRERKDTMCSFLANQRNLSVFLAKRVPKGRLGVKGGEMGDSEN